ncbi:MAG TPA: hypothetical protein VMX33_03905 [bacterium]|nr:hypothetical protein [bacterium]
MADKSLLKRAQALRKASGSELMSSNEFGFDKSSGISVEDQKDILSHIERVAQSSRILAGPDTWKVRPDKRGAFLPIVVNVAALLAIAGGIFGLSKAFSPDTQSVQNGSATLSSAEGRLLQEIKRESEGKIQEKDKEIASIQERMLALDKEKEQLRLSIDERIKAKEAELRDQLKVELEKERQRLIAQGLSEAAIQEKLKEFEKRKTEEFRAQLDEFAKKAEAERAALQVNLDKARDEYKKSLSDATAERQRIQDESRQREQELRAQLDDKSKALEAERAKTAVSLQAAQSELTRLNADASRVKAVEDRLLGLYASARQSLRDGRIDDAANTLVALRAYLSSADVAAIPALSTRRELDLFTADLIERAIGTERAKSGADTTSVTDALDALASIRAQIDSARKAVAAGDRTAAASAYRAALSATKELEEAGTFLEGSWKTDLAAKSAELDAANAALDMTRDLAANTKSAMGAINAAGRDAKALEAAFGRLLANLPLGPGEAAQAYTYIKDAGAREAEAARRATDSAAAGAPLRSAAADLSAEKYFDAIIGFASVLTRYPAAEQATQATEGLRQAGRSLAQALQDSRDKAAERIGTLEARLAEARDRIEALKAEADAAKAAGKTTAATSAVPATGTATSAEYAALQAAKAEVEADLAAAQARYDSVATAYQAYAGDEDRILTAGGDLAVIEARTRLDAFLSSPAIASVMPGMRERIARYFAAFQTAGQKDVLFNAADIVDGAVRIKDPAVRTRYFADLEARYASNAAMLEFLKSVRETFR